MGRGTPCLPAYSCWSWRRRALLAEAPPHRAAARCSCWSWRRGRARWRCWRAPGPDPRTGERPPGQQAHANICRGSRRQVPAAFTLARRVLLAHRALPLPASLPLTPAGAWWGLSTACTPSSGTAWMCGASTSRRPMPRCACSVQCGVRPEEQPCRAMGPRTCAGGGGSGGGPCCLCGCLPGPSGGPCHPLALLTG